MKIALPADVLIDAVVDLLRLGDVYHLRTLLNVSMRGIDRQVAQRVADEARRTCPYSRAVRGNIEVVINLI